MNTKLLFRVIIGGCENHMKHLYTVRGESRDFLMLQQAVLGLKQLIFNNLMTFLGHLAVTACVDANVVKIFQLCSWK